jgi:hypothetical protein
VFERPLESGGAKPVELYVRSTQLDTGRFPVIDGLPDPCAAGQLVWRWRGPDIRLDTPNASGQYRFPPGEAMGFLPFCDVLGDESIYTSVPANPELATRVYVQVHNRGVVPADGVRVMLLAANPTAGLPPLPDGYAACLQDGIPIHSDHWHTVGFATLEDVRAGSPKIASFDLHPGSLPPPANPAGSQHPCVLALVHHPLDPFPDNGPDAEALSLQERRAAHKNFHAVQFAGSPASRQALVIPFRICNPSPGQPLRALLGLQLGGFAGEARLYLPRLDQDGSPPTPAHGLAPGNEFDSFRRWADAHTAALESGHPYHQTWAGQRLADMQRILYDGWMFTVEDKNQAVLGGLSLQPGESQPAFLALDPPSGDFFDLYTPMQVFLWDEEQPNVVGGLSLRAEFAPEPVMPVQPVESRNSLEVEIRKWRYGYRVTARLFDPAGKPLSPRDRAAVRLSLRSADGPLRDLGSIKWHRAWHVFYAFVRLPHSKPAVFTVKAHIAGEPVVEVRRIFE